MTVGVAALLFWATAGAAGAAKQGEKGAVRRTPRLVKRDGQKRKATRGSSRLGRDVKRPKMSPFVQELAVDNQLPVDRGTGNFVYADHRELAELTYSIRRNNTTMYLIHTGVRGALKGQGAGKRLVEEAVIYAKANGLKIVPACEFARREFDKAQKRGDTRYADVELVLPSRP